MDENVFKKKKEDVFLVPYLSAGCQRENMGDAVPVLIYRMLQYSLRDEMMEQLGKEKTVELFRGAGSRAGIYFAQNFLDLKLPLSEFAAQLQAQLLNYKMGILRVEKVEEETGKLVLTIAEDADCSGLPLLGESVCNYDEGFIAGVLSQYTGQSYEAIEVDCWATGDRVCRFDAHIRNR